MHGGDYILDDYAATRLGPLMKIQVVQAAQYERQITALERNLALELANARETIALYKARKEVVEDHISLAKEKEFSAPMILYALGRSLEMVQDVERKLPGIRSQLQEIKNTYQLGRRRAKVLQADMEWKALSDFEQWRSTLLGKCPLSATQVKREWLRLLWRLLLAALFLLFFLSLCRAVI